MPFDRSQLLYGSNYYWRPVAKKEATPQMLLLRNNGFDVLTFIDYFSRKYLTAPVSLKTYWKIEEMIRCAKTTYNPSFKQMEVWMLENWKQFDACPPATK